MYSEFYPKARSKFSYLPKKSRDYILEYVNHLIQRQVSPSTLRHNIGCLCQFCRQLPIDKQRNLPEIKKIEVRHYVESLTHRNLSAGSINNHLGALKSFFSYMVDEDYMDKNPVLRRYYVEQAIRLPRPMREEDLEIFLMTLQNPIDKASFLLMLRSGLRIGEVCKLKVEHIKWENKNIIVFNGKGKVDRVTYMSEDLEAALSVWLETRGYISIYCFKSPYKKGGDKPISDGALRERMRNLLAQSGLQGRGYTPHSLRHTFATGLLNGGLPLPVLKDLMGHKTLNQTLMYAKLSNQTIRNSYYKAMENIERERSLYKDIANELFGKV